MLTLEYGIRCGQHGYRFVYFDNRTNQWLPETTDDGLRRRNLPSGLSLKLVIEGREVVLDDKALTINPAATTAPGWLSALARQLQRPEHAQYRDRRQHPADHAAVQWRHQLLCAHHRARQRTALRDATEQRRRYHSGGRCRREPSHVDVEPARGASSGFTLVEVLVALVIVAFGMGAVLAALSNAAANTAYPAREEQLHSGSRST